ncbi:MAG: histidine phosphatase family protein [Ardenticatenales bacterium]|nr:histidine phosphatase family protein [Ardenticatenales bacterium]
MPPKESTSLSDDLHAEYNFDYRLARPNRFTAQRLEVSRSPLTELHLIRHAESEANAGLSTVSPAVIALTERGQRQSAYIPAAITVPPTLIVTSPYLRTKQSAEPTVARFSGARQEEWPIQEFTYLCLTTSANTSRAQRTPHRLAYWERCDPEYVDGEGTESFAELIGRVQDTLTRLQSSPHPRIALFTHGLFIQTLFWYESQRRPAIDAQSMRECYNFSSSFTVPNASIIKAHLDETGRLHFAPVSTEHLAPELLS